VSPDGREVAFVSGGDIWTVPIGGGEARLLVSDPALEVRPLYSPDGKMLAFTSTRTGNGDIYVLDLNGGPYFAASLEAMAMRGRIILIGGVAGGKTEVDLHQILGKRLHVIGTVLRARSLQEKIALTTAFAREVVPLLATGTIEPVIDSVFSLDKIQDAHRRLESNETFGKVVLAMP